MSELQNILPLLNVLIVPALVFVVKIDRRMGQLDALSTVNEKRIDTLEAECRNLRAEVIRLECRAA